jgi:hypothetical protein
VLVGSKQVCDLCGKTFTTLNANQKMCNTCVKKIEYRFNHRIKGKCICCGKPISFIGRKGSKKYCSERCKRISLRVRSLIKYREHPELRIKNHGNVRKNKPDHNALSRLGEHIEAAKKAGLSYGMYMARKRMGKVMT